MTDLVQANRATWRRLSPEAMFRRAVAVIDTSGLLPIVEHNLAAATGRPRQFTAKALLVGMTLHSIGGARSMVMTDVIEMMHHLTPSQQHELGLGREGTIRCSGMRSTRSLGSWRAVGWPCPAPATG